MSTQGWNRYAYVHNNPIRYKDPTGHETDGGGIFGDIGFIIGTGVNVQFVEDDDGNIGFSLAYSKSLSTPNDSLHLGREKSTADTIYDLAEDSDNYAGSIGNGVSVAAEFTDLKGNGYASRLSFGPSVGWPLPVGASASKSETAVVGVNTKTVADDVKQIGNNIKDIVTGDKKITNLFDDLKNPFGYKSSGYKTHTIEKGWAKENEGNNDTDELNKQLKNSLGDKSEGSSNIYNSLKKILFD